MAKTRGKSDFDESDLIGHNGPPTDDKEFATEGVAADQLKSFVERIERLEEKKAGVAADIKEIYAEAKGSGFDTKVIRKIIGLRRRDQSERREEEAILELYLHALNMV